MQKEFVIMFCLYWLVTWLFRFLSGKIISFKKLKKFIQCMYSEWKFSIASGQKSPIVNIMSEADITPIPEIFCCQSKGTSKGSTETIHWHTWCTKFYSILSLQCIFGRFSNMAVFSKFVNGERLCCYVLAHDKTKKTKQDQSSC